MARLSVLLDPTKTGKPAQDLESKLRSLVVGQDEAIYEIVTTYQTHLAGMSPAKAHPYLVSFMRLGLVEQDRASGRYELGRAALQMGLACMRRLNPVRIGTEAIALLAEEIGHTVALALWGNHGPTVVASRRRAQFTSICGSEA